MSSARLKLLFLHAVADGAGDEPAAATLEWLVARARALPDGAAPWDEHAPRLAARLGHVATLERLLDENCPADPADLCAAAARAGDGGRALRMLREDYGADWDERCALAAIEVRDDAMLRWMLSGGAPLGAAALLAALATGAVGLVDCVLGAAPVSLLRARAADLCAAAAEQEDPRLLRGLHARLLTIVGADCGWTAHCAAAAARRRDVQLLAWAHEQGCPWDTAAPLAAARAARPDCLAYCLAHHCPAPPAAELLAAVGEFAAERERERERTADVAACVAMLKRNVPSERSREVKRRRLNHAAAAPAVASHVPDTGGAAACMRDWLMFPVRAAAAQDPATKKKRPAAAV